MRQIKFRGKSNSGKWVYGSLVWTEGQQPQIHFPIFFKDNPKKLLKWDWVYVDAKTVGQFTGLLDKNGNEIYEGDVIIATTMQDDNLECWCDGGAVPIQVIWDGTGFEFGDAYSVKDSPENFEVIGNIHEKQNNK